MSSPKLTKKIANAVSETPTNTDPLSSLRIKLKSADSEIRNYAVALEKENLKLQKQIAKLQAENVSLNNRVKVLEEENSKNIHDESHLHSLIADIKKLKKIQKNETDKKNI